MAACVARVAVVLIFAVLLACVIGQWVAHRRRILRSLDAARDLLKAARKLD